MTNIYASGASGMRAQQARIDTVANNLANQNATGFRAARLDLADVKPQPLEVAGAGDGTEPPALLSGGVEIAGVTHSFNTGPLVSTDDPLDLAILGSDGFFQVRTSDGQLAYTRDGAFRVDGDGRVVTTTGDTLEPPLALPAGSRVTDVSASGVVSGVRAGDSASSELGRITLARFANPNGLAAAGDNRFVATTASGPAETGTPGTAGFPPLQSRARESANVDVAEQLTTLIEAQRAYQMNVRSVQALDEMVGRVIETRN